MEENRKNNNRLVLLMIAGIPLTMILMASWLWYFVVRGDLDLVGMLGTANRGTLVQPPRQLDDVDLFEQTGVPIKYADLERRWTMLVPQVPPTLLRAPTRNRSKMRGHSADGASANE